MFFYNVYLVKYSTVCDIVEYFEQNINLNFIDGKNILYY